MKRNYVNLFVYGTLRRGFGLSDYMAGSEYIGEAVTLPRYRLTAAGIPFLHDGGSTAVRGEVYRVPVGPVLYRIRRIERAYDERVVLLDGGPDVDGPVYAYFMEHSARAGTEDIPSGDFADYAEDWTRD